MRKGKELSFAGEHIFCGVDVHKKSWKVNIRSDEFELEHFSQDPSSDTLVQHLNKNHPDAQIMVAYEAGFCGFALQRSLTSKGISCLVVNAADVPCSDKERKRKQDSVDARKISKRLSEGALQGIYVPEPAQEYARTLVRQRSRLVKDQSRCKNRIHHLLMFSAFGMEKERGAYWSNRFIQQLKDLDCPGTALRKALDLAIEEYVQVRRMLCEATRAVRTLAKEPLFEQVQEVLRSIKGVGVITGMVIQTEIQDMRRFKTLDSLCCYVGFVPDTADSGETHRGKGITHRCNWYLRTALIESAWMLVRYDPAMLVKYKQYLRRMPQNKAIVKIARHLLSRIRYGWDSGKKYEKLVVGGA